MDDLMVGNVSGDIRITTDIIGIPGIQGSIGPAGPAGPVGVSFPPVAIPDTTYTLQQVDDHKILYFIAGCDITVPTGLVLPFTVDIVQGGTDPSTVVGAAGVEIHSPDNLFTTGLRYVRLTLTAFSPDVYLLNGRTAAAPDIPDEEVILKPPENISLPIIYGDLSVDGILATTNGIWLNDPNGFLYQWRSDGNDIIGAEGIIYSVTEDDLGHSITSFVVAVNEDGEVGAESAPLGPVAGVIPVNTVAPSLVGASTPPLVGDVITVVVGIWTGVPTPIFTCQLKADGVPISGATNFTYMLTGAEEGDEITVTVVGENSAGLDTATSNPIGPVVVGIDTTGPTLTDLIVTSLSNSTMTYEVTTNSGGMLYAVVLPDAASNPSAEQIKAGTDADDNPAYWSGSIEVASIDTYGPEIVGPLGAGDTFDLYLVEYDSEDNPSNIITTDFTQPGGIIPVITDFSISDFHDTYVRLTMHTDTANGTFYAVGVPTAATAPNIAQIKAGTDGSGNPATAAAFLAITMPGVHSVELTGLTQTTTYDVYIFHEAAGNSAIQTDEFTTDTFVKSAATDGLATSFTPSSGCLPVATAQADSDGGLNAISVSDNGDMNPAASFILNLSTNYGIGTNRFRCRFKLVSGSGETWVRLRPTTVTSVPITYVNLNTGEDGTIDQAWDTTKYIDRGNGFFEFIGTLTMAGPDVSGFMGFNFASDDHLVTISRDGTHTIAFHELRITTVN